MPNSIAKYAEVVLPVAVKGTFTYSIPGNWSEVDLIGKRVIVQFGQGRKMYTAIVVKTSDNFPSMEVKEILEVLDEIPMVPEVTLKLWNWISEYYMCSIGEVMAAALPGVLNVSSESRFVLNPDSDMGFEQFSKNEKIILNALENTNELSLNDAGKLTGIQGVVRLMLELVNKQAVLINEEIKEKYKVKTIQLIGLGKLILGENDLEEVILSLKRAPQQLKLLMALIEKIEWDGENNENEVIKKSDLLKLTECSAASLKSLIDKEYLRIEDREESRLSLSKLSSNDLKPLNNLQRECFELITEQHEFKDVVLLNGVTSSGKTEIYAHLIEETISRGEQVLYLLPEISLTNQLITRLSNYFGNRVSVYHSRISQNERAEVWKNIADPGKTDIQIILGARSSLFVPFSNLGLIIVDEEHDRSFKQQDPAPRYEARDSAVVLAKLHKAKVLLGSATPSMESISNSLSGKYGYVELKKRFGGFEMPEILAVDLTEERRKRKMKGPFSSTLFNEIHQTLEKKEQIILFQNRRGYAPFIVCNSCTHTPSCKNCDVSLTHHKKRSALICHYCGYQVSMMLRCPECNDGQLGDVGQGTERIEEELATLFPTARLARFDYDSTRKKNAFQKLLNEFESKEIDILIGTQMVTKGLDFENVGLVGIINADNMLRFPDFRAFERTFQMLTQVSGRAGRNKKRGKVIVQTYDPFHPVIQFVLSGDYKGFVNSEFAERKLFKYPPFYRILDVKLKHRDRQVLYDSSRIFGRELQNLFGSALLGPEFPYIERIRNLYSVHFILKISKNASVSTVKKKLSKALADFTSKDTFKSLKAQIDVDPY